MASNLAHFVNSSAIAFQGAPRPKFRMLQNVGLAALRRYYLSKIHNFLRPMASPTSLLSGLSKIFSCRWISEYLVLVGCKNNEVFKIDVSCAPWKIEQITTFTRPSESLTMRNGVRSIRSDPSRSIIALGGSDSRDLVLLELESLRQMHWLAGHTEAVYDLEWLNDRVIASVDNGGSVLLFDLSRPRELQQHVSQTQSFHSTTPTSYRSISTLGTGCLFATSAFEAILTIWDSERLSPLFSYENTALDHFRCSTWNPLLQTVVVGATNHICCYDPRIKVIVQDVPVSDIWGIRSISTEGYRATICTGSGFIRFSDLRTGKFLPSQTENRRSSTEHSVRTPLLAHTSHHDTTFVSPGYHIPGGIFDNQSPWYMTHFAPDPVEQAIYTHEFDPKGTRLFVAGGPSVQSIPGCNASLWW